MTTQDWYHATPAGGRVGPMTADDLARLYQAGRIPAATPVWQAGMTDWIPLVSVAARLGLPPIPPPVPPAVLPPPRRGLHWLWIALLVVAGISVPVLAILAAIAMPAYNDYRLRAGVSEVMVAATPLRAALGAAVADGRACPLTDGDSDPAAFSNPEVDAARATLLAHRRVEGVLTADRDQSGGCELLLKLQGFDRPGLDGELLIWTLDRGGQWTCTGSVAARYLPTHCRP